MRGCAVLPYRKRGGRPSVSSTALLFRLLDQAAVDRYFFHGSWLMSMFAKNFTMSFRP